MSTIDIVRLADQMESITTMDATDWNFIISYYLLSDNHELINQKLKNLISNRDKIKTTHF
jgi:phage tail sheath gpL-like